MPKSAARLIPSTNCTPMHPTATRNGMGDRRMLTETRVPCRSCLQRVPRNPPVAQYEGPFRRGYASMAISNCVPRRSGGTESRMKRKTMAFAFFG